MAVYCSTQIRVRNFNVKFMERLHCSDTGTLDISLRFLLIADGGIQ